MPTTPTLAEVNEAMDAVNDALQDMDIPDGAEDTLNELSNILQKIQDAVIKQTEQALVDALCATNDELQALNKKINDLAGQLDSASATITKVANTVGTVASVIAALI